MSNERGFDGKSTTGNRPETTNIEPVKSSDDGGERKGYHGQKTVGNLAEEKKVELVELSGDERRRMQSEWSIAKDAIPVIKQAKSIDELYKAVLSVLPVNLRVQQEIPQNELGMLASEKTKLLKAWSEHFNGNDAPNNLERYNPIILAQYEFQSALKEKLSLFNFNRPRL